MLPFAIVFVVVWMFSRSCAFAENLSQADLIGTWRVEPSTYVVVPNQGNSSGVTRIVLSDGKEFISHDGSNVATLPELMPTNFTAFALTLHQDGSFVATNVPANFFFDSVTAEAAGTWKLVTNSAKGALSDKIYDYQELSMNLSKPRSLRWNTHVGFHKLTASSPQQPVVHIFVGNHRQVCLTKQHGPGSTGAASNTVPKHSENREPEAATNHSQPVRPDTNRTPSEPGSGR